MGLTGGQLGPMDGNMLETEYLGEAVDLGLEWYSGLRKVHEARNGVKDYTEKNLVKTWGVLRNSDLNIKRLHTKKNVDRTMGWGQSEPPKKHNPEAWSRLTGGVMEKTGPSAAGGRPGNLEEKDKMFRRNVYGFDGRFDRTQDITSTDVKKTIDKYHRSTVQDEKRLRKMELVIMQKDRQKKQEKAKATLKAKQTAMMKKLWPEGQPGTTPVQNNFQQSDTFEQSQTTDPRFIQVGNMTIDRFHWLVEGTIQEYTKANPDDFDFIYPAKLHAFWTKIPLDQKKKLQLTMEDNIIIDGKKMDGNSRAKETFLNYYRYFPNPNPNQIMSFFTNALLANFQKLQLSLILTVAGQIWQTLQISAIARRIPQNPRGSLNSKPKPHSKNFAKLPSKKFLLSKSQPPIIILEPESSTRSRKPRKPEVSNPTTPKAFSPTTKTPGQTIKKDIATSSSRAPKMPLAYSIIF